jgi:hypothetical protein
MQSRSLESGAARNGAGDEDPAETTTTVDGEAVSSRRSEERRRGRGREARPREGESRASEQRRRRVAEWGQPPAGGRAYVPLPVTGPVRACRFQASRAVPPGGRNRQPRHDLVGWSGPGRAVLGPGQKKGLVLDCRALGYMLIYTAA